jgi:hypothetical protein
MKGKGGKKETKKSLLDAIYSHCFHCCPVTTLVSRLTSLARLTLEPARYIVYI